MSEKHTPGPYEFDQSGGMIWTVGSAYGHDRMMVGMVRGWGHLTGTGACAFPEKKAVEIQEANGRLFAAAPDLLAACRAVLKARIVCPEDLSAEVELCRHAVAAADER